MAAPPTLPPGWFPDPHRRFEHRWYNGRAWTADVSNDGERYVDPLGAAPAGHTLRAAVTGGGNGKARAALACGISAAVVMVVPYLVAVGVPLALVAIGFGVAGRRTSAEIGAGRRTSTAGAVCGGAALALTPLGVINTIDVSRFLMPGPVESRVVTCEADPAQLTVGAEIRNTSGATRDYTVYAVVDEPTTARDMVAHVDDVAAGATERVTLERSTVSGGTACEARITVYGPRPRLVEWLNGGS